MIEDPRKTALKNGLRQLNNIQLAKVLEWDEEMILDEYNYHDGKFCPLAVACDLPETMENPTNEKVRSELEKLGYKVNNTKGVVGDFYTTNRDKDLLIAVLEVIKERGEQLIF